MCAIVLDHAGGHMAFILIHSTFVLVNSFAHLES